MILCRPDPNPNPCPTLHHALIPCRSPRPPLTWSPVTASSRSSPPRGSAARPYPNPVPNSTASTLLSLFSRFLSNTKTSSNPNLNANPNVNLNPNPDLLAMHAQDATCDELAKYLRIFEISTLEPISNESEGEVLREVIPNSNLNPKQNANPTLTLILNLMLTQTCRNLLLTGSPIHP